MDELDPAPEYQVPEEALPIGMPPPLPPSPELIQAAEAEQALTAARALPRDGRGRYFLAALLVIAALVVTYWGCSSYFSRLYHTVMNVEPLTGDDPNSLPSFSRLYSPFQWKKRHDVDFIFNGDTHRKGQGGVMLQQTPDGNLAINKDTDAPIAAQQRAIWEVQPANKVYFANYAILLLSQYSHDRTSVSRDFFTREMRLGMKVDPENALYHYLLADRFANEAIKGYRDRPDKNAKTGRVTYANYRVINRSLLDDAITELQAGAVLPYMHAYHVEMLNDRLSYLPTPRHAGDQLVRTAVAASVHFPEYARLRGLVRAAPFIAKQLAAEGHTEQAIAVLQTWRPLTRHTAEDSDSLIGVLVANALAKIAGATGAATLDDIGRPVLASLTRKQTASITRALDEFKRETHTPQQAQLENILTHRASVLAGKLLPIYGDNSFTFDELAPTRNLEYVLAEQALAVVLLYVLAATLVFHVISSIWWRRKLSRQGVTPPVIPVKIGTVISIYFFAVFLPLALYVLLTHSAWPGIREENIQKHVLIFATTAGLLFVLLSTIPVWLFARHLRRQYPECSLPLPPLPSRAKGVFVSIGVGIRVLLLSPSAFAWPAMFWLAFCGYPLWWMATGTLLGTAVYAVIFFLPYLQSSDPRWALRHGALSRTLAPLMAITVLLIGGVVVGLQFEERYWLAKDHLLFYQTTSMRSMTPIEERVVADLRGQMLRAISVTAPKDRPQ